MMILDSGNRQEFKTGSVRDMADGKGRCDLLPLEVIAEWMGDNYVLKVMAEFLKDGDVARLFNILDYVVAPVERAETVLGLAVHFEKGAEKYGERNWEKGIPVSSYVDSAIRHYLKHLAEMDDENHFIAFIWNVVCCIWTCANMKEVLGEG